jgi:hypothetical protein
MTLPLTITHTLPEHHVLGAWVRGGGLGRSCRFVRRSCSSSGCLCGGRGVWTSYFIGPIATIVVIVTHEHLSQTLTGPVTSETEGGTGSAVGWTSYLVAVVSTILMVVANLCVAQTGTTVVTPEVPW